MDNYRQLFRDIAGMDMKPIKTLFIARQGYYSWIIQEKPISQTLKQY